jgi:hypothetical protein
MKTAHLVLSLGLFLGIQAFADTSSYKCFPFRNAEASPQDLDLPTMFVITLSGEGSNSTQVELTGPKGTSTLKVSPWTRETSNSGLYDRYRSKDEGLVLIAKKAYSQPDHFTAKLQYTMDAGHGIDSWYGYNCRQ